MTRLRRRTNHARRESWRANNHETFFNIIGHKRTLVRVYAMSALPPKADMTRLQLDVR
jgi:hypothetical protein